MSALLAAFILYFSFLRCTPVERDRMLVVTVLIVFSVLFWALYEQMGSSLNLFSDRLVDRRIFGFELQAAQLQALPPTFVIVLAPVFAMLWAVLGARNADPSIPVKFAIGLSLIGLAFTMPIIGAALAGAGQKIGLLWFILVFAFMVCGELCMAPIAMNMVTRLCPKRVVGMMMGAYFLSLSIGSFVAAKLATLTSSPSTEVPGTTAAIAHYTSSFQLFAAIGIGGGVILFLFSPLLRSRMHRDS
jgi:POT family proton-dependent oligopeptide transporter